MLILELDSSLLDILFTHGTKCLTLRYMLNPGYKSYYSSKEGLRWHKANNILICELSHIHYH